MKKKSLLLNSFCFILIPLCFTQCKKDSSPLNITLYDKPIAVIQSYTQGKWRLQYTDGGFANQNYPAKKNYYMILANNKIVYGNDSAILVDTVVFWKQAPLGNVTTNLMGYMYTPGYAFPIYMIIYGIQNDTLLLRDAASDPFTYHYTKF